MHILWRGNVITRLRIASGLILFLFALFHFLNIGMGLVSADLMDRFQTGRQAVSRHPVGTIILYGAILIHAGLALWSLATRRTLRMPPTEALQMILGLSIPLLLIEHITHTRGAHQVFEVNDRMSYIMLLIWGSLDGWWQSLLLLIVWVHGCIGLNKWLSILPDWNRVTHWVTGLAVLVPAFALAGFLTEGRRIQQAFTDPDLQTAYREHFNFPDTATFRTLIDMATQGLWLFLALLAAAALVLLGRRLFARRRSVRIRYIDGPEIVAPKGLTLLEMSRISGVPHTSLCGGKGRCTTCRVVIENGADLLQPPDEAELRSLRAVNASPGTRLACQIRPAHPASVFRVFLPDGKRGRAHASQGLERHLAILFVDMRGFTARTTGQLPYDVVFLLNRFFDAIVPPIIEAGGDVDKYLGDGLLAVFETSDEKSSAQAGLEAAAGIGRALAAFNAQMAKEGIDPIQIGLGLHMGELVLGEIGSAGRAPRTIIGEAVNAASRIEGKTKELGVELLVSDEVLTCAGYNVETQDLIKLNLRGVPAPIMCLAMTRSADLEQIIGRFAAPSDTKS